MIRTLVIGTSFGGIEALGQVLPQLPKDLPLAVLVVLHIGNTPNQLFIKHLNITCPMRVKEADDKEPICPGTIYMAPPNYHLMVEPDETISLSVDSKINHCRPAIDVLFETAAWTYRQELMGLIMTGLNEDGAKGLLTIKELGGITLVQKPENAMASFMPASAFNTTQPHYVLPLYKIAETIVGLVRKSLLMKE